ncbi:hypothetical protein EON81_03080 [bacterium]|nr:MAG: hypothetical protein EON81_03080 [bacterium]
MSPPELSPDFRDLVESLTLQSVEFLIVGAYALAYHGVSRYTEDFDVWIARSEENARRLRLALHEFGMAMSEAEALALAQNTERFFTFGAKPSAVDILNFLSGCDFETAYGRSITTELDGLPVKVLSLVDYVATKNASGRPKDKRDLEALREAKGSLPGDPA